MLVFKPCENLLLLLPPLKFFTTTTTNSKPNLLHLHLHLHLHHHHHVKLHFPPLMAHFKSTFSSPLSPPPPSDSSSSLTTTTTTTTTTSVDFLMDSGGLSYVQAIQVIREIPSLVQDDGDRKPRSVIAYFESIGFSKTHISKVISKSPRVLVADVEKTLKPKIQLFQDFGFPDSDIADLIALQPSILHTSLENQIKPGLDLLKSFVKTNEDLSKAIKSKNNGLLLRSIHHRNSIEPNIHVLRHHGVPDSEILHFILTSLTTLMTTPKVFKIIVERIVSLGFKPGSRMFSTAVYSMSSMKKATWDSKIDLLKGLGWSDEQILDAFRRNPRCLTLSRENLKESIGFFVESMNWDASILSHSPSILNFSLKRRIIPRFAVLKCLMSKEIIKKDKQFIYMLKLPETDFLSKCVFKYQEQLPYLYELYSNQQDNGLITNQQDHGLITNQQDHGDANI